MCVLSDRLALVSLGIEVIDPMDLVRSPCRGQILGIGDLLGLEQQDLEIMAAVLPSLLAAKGASEEGMELPEGLVLH